MAQLNLPATGNRLLTTYRYMRDPYGTCDRWLKKYGKTFVVRAMNGDVVVTCRSENIRQIFAATHDSVGVFALETLRPLLGGQSVFLAEGQQHRLERALLLPGFHGERIQQAVGTIESVARKTMSGWQQGDNLRMMDVCHEISLEVILKIVFGIQSEKKILECKKVITEFIGSFSPWLAFSRWMQRPWFGLGPWNRFLRARKRFDELVHAEIHARQKSGGSEADLLTSLLEARYEDGSTISNSGIRDQLVTLLVAGHETTQIAMSWAMSWIVRNPAVLDSLCSELAGQESLEQVAQKSKLLNGICQEALRLNPVIPDVQRTLKSPMEFEECVIPAGATVAAATYLVHVDGEVYPEPLEFRPERWLERTYKPFEYMPFGGGIRRCIGASLAMTEMKIVLAALIRHGRFELPHDAPASEIVHRRNFTVAPGSGIPLVYLGPRS